MKSKVQHLLRMMTGFELKRLHPIEEKAAQLYDRFRDFTMVPKSIFIANLKLAYDYGNVAGCVVECGVWRGGMCAGIAEILKDKEFYLFDSFEGLPQAKEIDGERALRWQRNVESPSYYDNCRAEIDFAKRAMEMTGVKHKLTKGWFNETLPHSIVPNIAILRLDADWYESTMDCLINLFDKVCAGGIIMFDDYYVFEGCRRAVHDFLSLRKDASSIRQYADTVAYIIKGS